MKQYLSPCKINLGLEVLSKRDDGFHNINTIFYRLEDPHDTLVISDSPSFMLTSNEVELNCDETNLIIRAMQACCVYKGRELPPFHVHIEKKLPMGAGIGGGSGNAATAIDIFSELVEPLTSEEKMELARTIGADVAFFTSGLHSAKGSGIGNELTKIEFSIPYPILLVRLPDLVISTKEAYARIDISAPKMPTDLLSALSRPIEEWKNTVTNDFEAYAFEEFPDLEEVKNILYENGASFSLMSGSGSLVYGIFKNIRNAKAATLELAEFYPDMYAAASMPPEME
jgi:4-diphosphocytidyl-2-C-methyl-D-erythritol kinase